MSSFESDAVAKTLQRALMESHHVLRHEADKVKGARKLFVEFRQAAADELRKLHAKHGITISESVVELTKLSTKLETQLGLIEIALRIGQCGCSEAELAKDLGAGNGAAGAEGDPAQSVTSNAGSSTPTEPAGRSATFKTAEEIERDYIERKPSNVVPLRKVVHLVKPPRPGGAA